MPAPNVQRGATLSTVPAILKTISLNPAAKAAVVIGAAILAVYLFRKVA
ncbi:MAG TPA: hypothetical protein VKA67_01995 [Verrucomicrobiae bacterium]|nr:hypothetical protein [Verrucomicrobiae bacterium]